jgi:Flp pilus assembly protein TadG
MTRPLPEELSSTCVPPRAFDTSHSRADGQSTAALFGGERSSSIRASAELPRKGHWRRNGLRRRTAHRAGSQARRRRGQSLVEFALVLTPFMLVLMGIIQFGFIFNAYVTMSSAAREAARTATVYPYDTTLSKAANDAARAEAARQVALVSLGSLSTTTPRFTTSSTWTASGSNLIYTTGDMIVTYSVPSGVTDSNERSREYVRVDMSYHLDIIVPFLSTILPHDNNGRMLISSTVTMVIN